MHVERALAEHMVALGARAFVPKDARLAELRTAIDAARLGSRFISPRVPPHSESDAQRYPRGYLQLTVAGTPDRADDRYRALQRPDRRGAPHQLSHVHFHRTNIRRKLGFRSDYEMNRFALMVLQADAPENSDANMPDTGTPVRPAV